MADSNQIGNISEGIYQHTRRVLAAIAYPNVVVEAADISPNSMDFICQLLKDAPARMAEHAVMVLEIGNKREHFEAAFPQLEAIWLKTSAGNDQVLLLTRAALAALA